ncbi:hypothetical protein HRG84_22040 [Flavisolibacter sp. BT320]|nr:hypothetical protein [Flavisolibacter longurius]
MRFFLFVCFFVLTIKLPAQTVYKTPSGKKYHVESCRMVKNVSEALDVKAALEKGLGPCSICGPVTLPAASLPASKAQGQGQATKQCRGYTKKGSRCKHMTSIGNGYCYQHQP